MADTSPGNCAKQLVNRKSTVSVTNNVESRTNRTVTLSPTRDGSLQYLGVRNLVERLQKSRRQFFRLYATNNSGTVEQIFTKFSISKFY